jgi:hypothetical protein
MDWYKLVPKDYADNLQWRWDTRKRCEKDPAFRASLLRACKEDVLFWLNGFAFVYEPRVRYDSSGHLLPKSIPFITWPHQDPVIREIHKNLGVCDIVVEKSRGEGMSWIGVMLAIHEWLFDDMAKVGLVSNTEKKADDPGNMDSLMAKGDWELDKLPKWMAGVKDIDWKRNLADHSLVNKRNGAQINAFAATADAGRAGRYKWFLADELAFWDRPQDSRFMASIRGSTDCRLSISTPNGAEGEYYHIVNAPAGSNIVKLRMHWSANISKNRGLYKITNGKPEAVDPSNPLPTPSKPYRVGSREFVYDPPNQEVLDLFSRLRQKGMGPERGVRSPWYDLECDRADATKQSIAQELDLDYGGSTYRIFTQDFMDRATITAIPPILEGVVNFDAETLEPTFSKEYNGPVKLWTALDMQNSPPRHRYVVSADISSGLGGSFTSNSVCQVIDMVTMEQVLEFASNTLDPVEFADHCMAIGKWFHHAYLIWEINGPGGAFTKRVKERGYSHVYNRVVSLDSRGNKKTKKIGWFTNEDSKEKMFASLLNMVKTGQLTLRSQDLVKECREYVRLGGKIEHIGSRNSEDDSSKGKAHGDRVMSLGVCLMGVEDRPLPPLKKGEEAHFGPPPPNTMAARELAHHEKTRQRDDDWQD